MDTIVLCHTIKQDDWLYPNHIKLLSISKPVGLKYWKKEYSKTETTCFYLKINCHDACQALNITEHDLCDLKLLVSDWLDCADLLLEDFHINRIDYDYNIRLSNQEIKLLMNILKPGTLTRSMHMGKHIYTNSIYYSSMSRHVQLYSKNAERKDKGYIPKPWELGVLREEVQCFSEHIKHMKRYHELPPTWEKWVTIEKEQWY